MNRYQYSIWLLKIFSKAKRICDDRNPSFFFQERFIKKTRRQASNIFVLPPPPPHLFFRYMLPFLQLPKELYYWVFQVVYNVPKSSHNNFSLALWSEKFLTNSSDALLYNKWNIQFFPKRTRSHLWIFWDLLMVSTLAVLEFSLSQKL